MVSVVIVTYNSEACLGGCLSALKAWLPDTERLVIDNASTDDSRAIAEHNGATLVALDKNIGFGRACDLGAHRAQQDHILFLNPDVTIHKVDTSELITLCEASSFGLVTPASTSRFTFRERRWAQEALSLTLGPLRPRELTRRLPSRPSGHVTWASGAALLVRASEFLGLGGFDDRYFMYFEDRDLSWRYRASGLSVRSTSALVADHIEGSSSGTGDLRPDLLAYSLMGWLQYTYAARGPRAAERAWRLAQSSQTASKRIVGMAAQIAPVKRLRRKRQQLDEVTRELNRINASSGVLKESDGCAYWPDAVALLSRAHRR